MKSEKRKGEASRFAGQIVILTEGDTIPILFSLFPVLSISIAHFTGRKERT